VDDPVSPAGSPYQSDRKYNNGRPATPLAGRFFVAWASRLKVIPLSLGRQTVADLSWASLRVPRCVMTARIAIPRCLAARAALPAPRPPWTTLFLKAFATVSITQPALRRVHATLPSPRLIEAEQAIGCIILERADDTGLGFARITEPHHRPLPELAALLHQAKAAPAPEEKRFGRIQRFARLPWPLRRLLLRLGLALGAPLLRYGGTFAISTVGEHGAGIVDSVSILPCFLTYGPIGADGAVEVYLAFDHRVMDGADGAAALAALQSTLEGAITAELTALAPTNRAGSE